MADPVTIGLMVGATLLSTYGQIQQGKAAEAQGQAQAQQSEYEAKQRESVAGQERANAQRRSMEEQRQKRLVLSRASAVSGASGASGADVGFINTLADIEEEGDYNSSVALYEGEERARSLETGAAINRYEGSQALAAGKQAKKSSYLSAGSTILKGAYTTGSSKLSDGQSMFERYGS